MGGLCVNQKFPVRSKFGNREFDIVEPCMVEISFRFTSPSIVSHCFYSHKPNVILKKYSFHQLFMEDQDQPLTVNDAVDKIATDVNFKMVLLLTVALLTMYTTAGDTYLTVFTGFIPYTEWECVSDRCFHLLENANSTREFYTEKHMCDNDLVAGIDFNWTSTRTSFSMEWEFYCGTASKLTVASSFFFIGAFLGLLSSTAIFDQVGRKNGAISGVLIAGVASIIGTWTPSYEVLLAIRVFQGFGQFINFTGAYCWIFEFSPSSIRESVSAISLDVWAVGYLIVVGIAYLITDWRYIFMTQGILDIVSAIPLLLLPVSPRFSLVRGQEEQARKTLTSYSRLCNNETSFDDVKLVYEERRQNYWKQIGDFRAYPTMLKETLRSMLCWFIVAALFYGFSFGWNKISKELYMSYFLDALSKLIAFSLTIPACKLLGRKRSLYLFLLCGVACNLLAMPDVRISDNWTLEYIACLIGSIGTSAAFALLYLYTSEISPTSHRGMIMSLSSSAARIGSFIGPYTSLLYDVTDRRVVQAIFAIATLLIALAVFFQPETTDMKIPETPRDVETRKGSKKYKQVDPENYEMEEE